MSVKYDFQSFTDFSHDASEEIFSPKIKQLHNPVNTECNFRPEENEIKQIEFAQVNTLKFKFILLFLKFIFNQRLKNLGEYAYVTFFAKKMYLNTIKNHNYYKNNSKNSFMTNFE